MQVVSLHLGRAPSALLLRVLEAMRAALTAGQPLPSTQHFGFELERVLERLTTEGVPETAIAPLEWFFLPLLHRGRQTSTLALHRQMARDPALFAEMINAVYRAHDQNPDEEPAPTDQDVARAQMAYELLTSSHVIPGTQPDGTIDAAGLNAWVNDARERCLDSSRAAVGDQHIGQILAHAGNGTDGVWPDLPIREVIERVASAHLETGIATGVFNSGGAMARALDAGGEQEREIARRYRGYAEASRQQIHEPQASFATSRTTTNNSPTSTTRTESNAILSSDRATAFAKAAIELENPDV